MKNTTRLAFLLVLSAALGVWGQSSSTGKVKTASAKPGSSAKAAEKKSLKPANDPVRDDSLRRAHAEQRRLRIETHQKERRERYLARLTPEQRVRAEEAEKRREAHVRVQDSLNGIRLAEARLRIKQQAELQKALIDSQTIQRGVSGEGKQVKSKSKKK